MRLMFQMSPRYFLYYIFPLSGYNCYYIFTYRNSIHLYPCILLNETKRTEVKEKIEKARVLSTEKCEVIYCIKEWKIYIERLKRELVEISRSFLLYFYFHSFFSAEYFRMTIYLQNNVDFRSLIWLNSYLCGFKMNFEHSKSKSFKFNFQ